MPDRRIHGIVPILVTPFDQSGELDLDSLRRLVGFTIDAGVHGLGVALGSEVFKLTEGERDSVTRVVVDEVAGRVPVVVNTGAAGTAVALSYSRRAQELGADAVMVTPPSFVPVGPSEVRGHYRALSDALDIPIVVQDHASGPVPPALVRQLAEDSARVRYVKVEVQPSPPRVAQAVREVDGAVDVLGGSGGSYLIEELRRGATGTMPGCSQPRSFVRVWDLYHDGRVEDAARVFAEEILPLNRLAHTFDAFFGVHKQLLARRGVISCAHVRQPSAAFEPVHQAEVDEAIDRLLALEAGG